MYSLGIVIVPSYYILGIFGGSILGVVSNTFTP